MPESTTDLTLNPAMASIAPAALCAATSAVFVALAGAFLMGLLLIEAPGIFVDAPEGASTMRTYPSDVFRYMLYAASGGCFFVAIRALRAAAAKLP